MLFHDFDAGYLERLRSGDFRTQEHFVGYFSQLLHLKLRSRLRDSDAEDVRQETFTRVFAALRGEGTIRQPERLGAFVNSVCNNVLLEHYRSSSREVPLEDDKTKDFPDQTADILGVVVMRQTQESVRLILDEMPERDRRLIKEVFLEEGDKDRVCRDFGVDRDYLRVLMHRAKQSFKSLYLKRIAARSGDLPG